MFTVIICDKHIIDDCNSKYFIYLKPLLENNNFIFCEWDTSGESLDEAVPGLKKAINRHNEWQALIVLDRNTSGYDSITKRNPFDVVNARKLPSSFENCEEIIRFRNEKEAAFNMALDNPLTRLSIWLAGMPQKVRPVLPDEYSNLPDISDPAYCEKLEQMNLNPVEVEINLSRLKKYDMISEKFERDGALFDLPKNIIALSERTTKTDLDSEASLWKKHNEFDYSRFYDDNLYPDKLRYLLFNIPYIQQERNELVYFNFLTTILTLAENEPPHDAIRPNRVYRIKTESDPNMISGVCSRYREKLLVTHSSIMSRITKAHKKERVSVSNEEAQRIFESEFTVLVEIRNDFNTDQLFCQYKQIGFAKDCPSDEESFWDSQYRRIGKLFIRYMREPRRAVKTAVDQPFRVGSVIEDDRAFCLNEYQKEDIDFKLQDEEQSMVECLSNSMFDIDEYNRKIAEADKELRRGIAQRMTRRKAVVIGLIAILAYFMGFLPFFIDNLSIKTLSLAFMVTTASLAVFSVSGLICLLILRHRLLNRFKHFNYVMSGIISDVKASLAKCSKYLSHACNVMREFSVKKFLLKTDDADSRKCKIMKSHLHTIESKLDDVTRLFSDYLKDIYDADIQQPYDYDFTVIADYDYPMPYVAVDNEIEYIQPGNVILLPIDYINSLTLEREELYE